MNSEKIIDDAIAKAIAAVEASMLPSGEDAYSQAVVSVFRRGFHDKAAGMADDWQVMSQFLRLIEEVGEFQEAIMWQPSGDKARQELADVMIVLCQISWLTGMEPAELAESKDVQKRAFCYGVGHLSRCLRKETEADFMLTHEAIKALAYQVHLRAKQFDCDIAEVMRAKCGEDEGRGYRHEGKKDSRLPTWEGFSDLVQKAISDDPATPLKVVDYGKPSAATVVS